MSALTSSISSSYGITRIYYVELTIPWNGVGRESCARFAHTFDELPIVIRHLDVNFSSLAGIFGAFVFKTLFLEPLVDLAPFDFLL